MLKINLRVTLEKIRSLEGEVAKLKSQAKVSIGMGAPLVDLDSDGFPDLYIANLNQLGAHALYKNRGDGTFEDVTAAAGLDLREKALEQAMKVRPGEMESALKLLWAAKDPESRRRAVDQMEQVMKKLREEVRPPTEKKKIAQCQDRREIDVSFRFVLHRSKTRMGIFDSHPCL